MYQPIDRMSQDEQMDAYRALKNRFDLKARQRDALDNSPYYEAAVIYAHMGLWHGAGMVLVNAGIIEKNPEA